MINVEVVRCDCTPDSIKAGVALFNERTKARLSAPEAADVLGMTTQDLYSMELGYRAPANVTYAEIVAEYRRAAEA